MENNNQSQNKWSNYRKQLKHKYRFVVMDSETYAEKFWFHLTGTNIFTGIGLSIIGLICLTAALIVFTPLREYIPDYANQEVTQTTYSNADKVDSLARMVDAQEQVINNIRMMVFGEKVVEEIIEEKILKDSITKEPVSFKDIELTHSQKDSLFRIFVEGEYIK